MAAIVLNDIVEARNICTVAADGAVNVRHYKATAVAGAGATDLEVAEAIATVYKPVFRDCMAQNATWVRVDVRRIFPNPQTPTVSSTLASVAGTFLSDTLPRQTAGLVTLRTAAPSRAGRGRVFIPFPAETGNGPDGSPNLTYAAVLATLGAVLDDPIITAGPINNITLTPVIWHPVFQTTDIVTSVLARAYWGTQRRRNNNRF